MGAEAIISVAVPAAQLLLRAIEAANNGDAAAAGDYLASARKTFDAGSAAWEESLKGDAAGGASAG